MSAQFKYPSPRRDETVIDKLHGIDVPDPYRYFEDPDAEETKKFVQEQNQISEPYLDKCPHRQKIKQSLTRAQNYPRVGCPFKRGNKYYFYKNTGLQAQSVLYQQDTLNSEPSVFFDPNTLSEDGTVALSVSSFSEDGQYFAYSLSYSGSDWLEIHVKDVNTGQDLKDKLTKAKFTSIEWTHDNKGFFYSQYPNHEGDASGKAVETNINHTLYYHLLNTDQDQDAVKVSFPEHPDWKIMNFDVSQDGKYLHVYPRAGCHERAWWYCDLSNFKPQDKLVLKPIYEAMDCDIGYVASDGSVQYFMTNLDAPNYRVAKLDLNKPVSKENWLDVVPNDPDKVIDMAEIFTVNAKDYILLGYVHKVVYQLELRELGGQTVKKFNLQPGSVYKYQGRRDDNEFFYQFTSFLTPSQIYFFDLKDMSNEPILYKESKPNNFDPADYKIEQVFYKSKDGTEVPMFIIGRKDVVLDGSNPCLLYGYGGFGIKITSAFNINRVAWYKDFKGIMAVANIRGGGELGQKWHDAGRLLNKKNCFHDFISAAEFLIGNKYTSRDKLAIEGGSNGGLLVAASANLRPDLFGASLCHVGVLDMIRYVEFTCGIAWRTDYGDPKEEEHFKNLIDYSPYHNIPDSVDNYPATLLLTADHDDRVVPAHSLKFIAQLQYKLGEKLPDTPLLVRVDTKSGHGSGKPISKVIDQYADIYSFLYTALGLKDFYNPDS